MADGLFKWPRQLIQIFSKSPAWCRGWERGSSSCVQIYSKRVRVGRNRSFDSKSLESELESAGELQVVRREGVLAAETHEVDGASRESVVDGVLLLPVERE